jgi:hypothetical protein
MWYKAKSVIEAINQCDQLSIIDKTFIPSCPKKGSNNHCLNDFPDCEGKTQKCSQKLQLANKKEIQHFFIFIHCCPV